MSEENNVIENEFDYTYKCELCKKKCSYGVNQLQKIVDEKIYLVCEDCFNE